MRRQQAITGGLVRKRAIGSVFSSLPVGDPSYTSLTDDRLYTCTAFRNEHFMKQRSFRLEIDLCFSSRLRIRVVPPIGTTLRLLSLHNILTILLLI